MNKIAIGILLSGFLCAGGDKTLSGKWEVQVEGYGAPRTQKFELKQKGEDLTGVYAGKFGESKVSGTVKDAAVEFESACDRRRAHHHGPLHRNGHRRRY